MKSTPKTIARLYDRDLEDQILSEALLSAAQERMDAAEECDDQGDRLDLLRAARVLLKEAEYVLTRTTEDSRVR